MARGLFLKDGTKVPSISKILENNYGWNKSVLIDWYYRTMKEGKDPKEINNISKKTGILCHDFVSSHINNKKIKKEVLDKNSTKDIIIAENVLERYKILEEEYDIKIEFEEKTLVSERYKYGGRLDLYGTVRGRKAVIDGKTSPKVYQDSVIQLSSYDHLLVENGYSVDDHYILSMNKDITCKKEDLVKLIPIPKEIIREGFEIFRCLLWLNNKKESFYA